jgi:hypothetical protein
MRTHQHGFFDLLLLYIYLLLYLTRDLSTGFAFDLVNFDAFLPHYQAGHLCIHTDSHTLAHVLIVTLMYIYISPTYAQ